MLGFWLAFTGIALGIENHRENKRKMRNDTNPYCYLKSDKFYKENNSDVFLEMYKVFIRKRRRLKVPNDEETIKLLDIYYSSDYNPYFHNREEARVFFNQYKDC